MMILPFLVVLLAASGYLHASGGPIQDADRCSQGLGVFIAKKCSSSKSTFTQFSPCSYTCTKKSDNGQITSTTHFLPNGLPCDKCKECCDGNCQSVQFEFRNPLTLKKPCSK
uniref:Putative ixostatin n=1 Tax=Ixodes ricinus TaxID=34613 RepID=A0A0K8R4E2_IXORI